MYFLGVDPTWGGLLTVVQRSKGILAVLLIPSMTTTETINREIQREVAEARPAPTTTHHSTAYPGGGASERIMAVSSAVFQPALLVKRHENRVVDPKHGGYSLDLDTRSCIGVDVPRVTF